MRCCTRQVPQIQVSNKYLSHFNLFSTLYAPPMNATPSVPHSVIFYALFCRETTLVVYAFSLVGMIIYTFTLAKGILVVYIVSGILG